MEISKSKKKSLETSINKLNNPIFTVSLLALSSLISTNTFSTGINYLTKYDSMGQDELENHSTACNYNSEVLCIPYNLAIKPGNDFALWTKKNLG